MELTAMTTKTNSTLYLDSETINLAHELGLNISKTCEIALKLAINRLQGTNTETNVATSQFGAKFSVVDRAGFEPAASALRTRRSYQADLPAQLAFWKNRVGAHLELSVRYGWIENEVVVSLHFYSVWPGSIVTSNIWPVIFQPFS